MKLYEVGGWQPHLLLIRFTAAGWTISGYIYIPRDWYIPSIRPSSHS